MMELKEVWLCNIAEIYSLFQSFPKNENGFENPTKGMSLIEFKQWILTCEKEAKGIELEAWKVPQTVYILFNDAHIAVGIFKLRHYLNESLRNGAGHIGFGIGAPYRRKGYAVEGLKLCLEKARKLNIDEIYLSCYKYNAGSLNTQLKCGAYIHHEDEQEYYTRIPLKENQ